MKAIVIGGGIGGPVTAIALKRAGIEAVVYEAHEGPADSLGLFLGLGVKRHEGSAPAQSSGTGHACRRRPHVGVSGGVLRPSNQPATGTA